MRRQAAGPHQMGDPMGEDAGFPAPGAGEDQERPVSVQNRFPLAIVQAPEELVGLGVGRRHAQNSQRRFRSTLYSSSTSLPVTPAVTPRRTIEPLMNMISESPYSTDTSCSVEEEKPW